MKVLSVRAPWAQLLARGAKDVENRTRAMHYRGPLAIHCTKTGWSTEEAVDILAYLVADGLITWATAAAITTRLDADRGKLVGVCEVTGCRSSDGHPSPWAMPGGQAIEVARARPVIPVEHRGEQGLRDLDPKVARSLVTQLDLRGWYLPGVIEANEAWGTNCGPKALAAALNLGLDTIRSAVAPDGTFKGHMGVADLKAAIERAGGRIVRAWSKPDKMELTRTDGAPIVVLIRFGGPWDAIPDERARARAGARHRHVIVYRHGRVRDQEATGIGWVFDANNLVEIPGDHPRTVAVWTPLKIWREYVLPDLVPDRGNGETVIDWMAQVERVGGQAK